MADNETGAAVLFNGKAKGYAAHRPGYPGEFINYLYTEAGFSRAASIADIGAGTGKLTRLLLQRGSTVYAVEANHGMLAQAEKELSAYPGFVPVAGRAEETGLPEGTLDFITAAQAFHWFDRPAFQKECKRLLKPNGKVVLVWNLREECALNQENERILRAFCPDFKGFAGGMAKTGGEDISSFFLPGCQIREFPHTLTFTEEGFVGRNVSGSYALKESEPKFREWVAALQELFRAYAEKGVLRMPNITRSYMGRV